ncbi:MAG: tetratricopeptide repeat protein [Bacteroidales bacterium]|nr:tetratricopeptide repeat protein [Bacteroidales bacterium]
MKKKIKSICLLLLVFKVCFCQVDGKGSYDIGFKYFKATDNSRNYVIGQDTVNRPMLIHFWYPSQNNSELKSMSFKDYIDLIAIREYFDTKQQDIDIISYNFIDAYLGFSKQLFGIDTLVTTEDVLNSPVKAIFNAEPIVDEFPMIIYAPSNSKSAVQNHIMCEYLASNGFYVVSVGSAGYESLNRYDQGKATLAQVQDMEFIVKYISDSLKLNFPNIGLFGFSTGSMATIIYQMRTPEVKAVASLDGSHEYAFYPILINIDEFSFDKANVPYLMIANKFKDFSVFPYYSSIPAKNKYLYKMTAIDHNGFISYWYQFALCSKNDNINSITESYTVMCESVNDFFNATLKLGIDNPKEFEITDNELIQKDTADYNIIAQLLNKILKEGIDFSIKDMKSNESLYKDKASMINVMGKMFLGNKNDNAIKIFTANTEINPESSEGFYFLAIAYKEENNIEAAKVAITKAKDIDNDNEDIKSLYDEIMNMNSE